MDAIRSLGAPHHRDDVGRRGDLGRVTMPSARLAERHDVPVVAELVKLRAAL